MAKIKPFYGVHPNPFYVGDVVLELENLSLSEAKIIRQENPYSFVNMLVPKLDNLFLRGSKNELAFKQISENYQDFLDKGIYHKDSKGSLYVYRITNAGKSQTGLWAVTSVDDYFNGNLKKHEHTRPDREESLANYLQHTGIDANPVLITYRTNERIDQILAIVTKSNPLLTFEKQESQHELWNISDEGLITELTGLFSDTEHTYIADGHHRAAAAALHAQRQRSLGRKDAESDFFTSVYMSEDELNLFPFHRMVKDLNDLDKDTFLGRLSDKFTIEPVENSQMPQRRGQLGMYVANQWYTLQVAEKINEEVELTSILDVSILQDHILGPILGVTDPRTSDRINFPGANIPLEKLIAMVDNHEFAVLFTLFPVDVDLLMQIADQGGIMPPKSTLFTPKFQAGLLIHEIS